jgi:uncharacterized damage-inducible protein DinB
MATCLHPADARSNREYPSSICRVSFATAAEGNQVIGGNDELISILRDTPAILQTLIAGMTDEEARVRPQPGGWSVIEVVGHLVDAERRALDRMDQLQREENPHLEGYDQMELVERQRYREQRLPDVLQTFEGLRTERIAALEALDASGWERSGAFARHGPVTLREIVIHMCRHDVTHLAQIAGKCRND